MSKAISSNLRCNEQIRIPQIRVIGAENEQLGVLATHEALRMARDQGLDLVEVAPRERPPVCRIMDYGKFKYHQKKHQKKQHEQQLKEVRLRPKTDANDREIKVRRALKFLSKGDKVQFTMMFRGRERAHREIGDSTFRELITRLGDLVKVERFPLMEGRNMIMVLAPNKAAFEKLSREARQAMQDVADEDDPDDADDADQDAQPSPGTEPASESSH